MTGSQVASGPSGAPLPVRPQESPLTSGLALLTHKGSMEQTTPSFGNACASPTAQEVPVSGSKPSSVGPGLPAASGPPRSVLVLSPAHPPAPPAVRASTAEHEEPSGERPVSAGSDAQQCREAKKHQYQQAPLLSWEMAKICFEENPVKAGAQVADARAASGSPLPAPEASPPSPDSEPCLWGVRVGRAQRSGAVSS